MKPLELDGFIYTKQTVLDMRDGLIKIRDEAIEKGNFNTAVILSHLVAMMKHYADNIEE